MPGERRKQTLLWRWMDEPGMEYFRASEEADGVTLAGLALGTAGGGPCHASYEVRCDNDWRTRLAGVRLHADDGERSVTLARDDGDRWTVDGESTPALDGCVDVDIGFTPSTNTLAIRRLRLSVGASATIEVAWVEWPTLRVGRVPQRYTRLSDGAYRFEDRLTGFTADVVVDEQGWVVSYPPGWARVETPPR